MGIDPKAEEPTRKMLGHAMRGELEDLAALVRAEGNDVLAEGIALCVYVSGYIVVDVCGRWPTEADMRRVAHNLARNEMTLDLVESEVYDYLSRAVLGTERLDQVFPIAAAGTLPLLITASLLANYRPDERHWWEYLDQIWDAAEAAERTSLSVLPALVLRAWKEDARKRESRA